MASSLNGLLSPSQPFVPSTNLDMQNRPRPGVDRRRLPGLNSFTPMFNMEDVTPSSFTTMEYSPSPDPLTQKRSYHQAFPHSDELENQGPHTPHRPIPPPPPALPTTLPTTKVEAIATQMGLTAAQRHNLLSFAKVNLPPIAV
jgi:hypothetical protein